MSESFPEYYPVGATSINSIPLTQPPFPVNGRVFLKPRLPEQILVLAHRGLRDDSTTASGRANLLSVKLGLWAFLRF